MTIRCKHSIVGMLLLAGCTPSGESIGAQMDAHSEYLRTEAAITDALNGPNGADFPAAVRIVEKSKRDALQKDYDIGTLLISSCRDRDKSCTGAATARAGLARLYRVATNPGEDREIAAGDLAFWFARGAGDALKPDAGRAACWTGVRDGKTPPSECPLP